MDSDATWLGRLDVASGRYLPLLEDGDVEPLLTYQPDAALAVAAALLHAVNPLVADAVGRVHRQEADDA